MVGRVGRLVAVVGLTGCAAGPDAVSPVSPAIIAAFGGRHAGVDIRAPIGTPVLAAADGQVRIAGERPRDGRMIVLRHADDLATVYMHLSEVSVHAGQSVRRGEPIGRAGMTGNATTPHLHFAVCRRPGGRCAGRIDGGWDDPGRYWVEAGPCFDPRRAYPEARRLTFPLACAD